MSEAKTPISVTLRIPSSSLCSARIWVAENGRSGLTWRLIQCLEYGVDNTPTFASIVTTNHVEEDVLDRIELCALACWAPVVLRLLHSRKTTGTTERCRHPATCPRPGQRLAARHDNNAVLRIDHGLVVRVCGLKRRFQQLQAVHRNYSHCSGLAFPGTPCYGARKIN